MSIQDSVGREEGCFFWGGGGGFYYYLKFIKLSASLNRICMPIPLNRIREKSCELQKSIVIIILHNNYQKIISTVHSYYKCLSLSKGYSLSPETANCTGS